MPLKNFIGSATVSLDDKGRCSFPREHRKNLSDDNEDTLIVTIGPSRSLLCFPLIEWNQFVDELNLRPKTPENIRFARQVIGMARESVLDKQNRLVLSVEQMTYAQIKNEVLFLGEGHQLSLWNPERYHEMYSLQTEQDFEMLDQGFYWSSHTSQSTQ